MGEEDRFGHLEGSAPLPDSTRSAIERLGRFQHLEIGTLTPPAPVQPSVERILCPNCGQSNEKERALCWACSRPLSAIEKPKPQPDQPIELILDGVSYSSESPDLPEDIRQLIARIRAEGYSQALLDDWNRRRHQSAFSPILPPASALPPLNPPYVVSPPPRQDRVQFFEGQRVSVLRLDGQMYRSDDPALPEEIREIFDYVHTYGVTPMLMQHLRLYGTKVKFRPVTTPMPSDGDIDFWKATKNTFGL